MNGEYHYSKTPGIDHELAKEIQGAVAVGMEGSGHFAIAENYPVFKRYVGSVIDRNL